MLPSKKFFVNAGLILLVAVICFGVAEYRRSKLNYVGAPIAFQSQTGHIVTEEEVNAYINETIETLSRQIALSERANTSVALLEPSQSQNRIAFDAADLPILQSPSATDVKNYGIKATQAIAKAFENNNPDELTIFYRMIENQDLEEGAALSRRERAYTQAALSLAEIPTPTSAVFMHVSIINILFDLADALAQMNLAFADQGKAIIAVRFFELRSDALAEQLELFNNYFAARDITFSGNETAPITIYKSSE